MASWRSMMKIEGSGSGSISQRHGSADPDPDPHQNIMDPQHCWEDVICLEWRGGKAAPLRLFRGEPLPEPHGFRSVDTFINSQICVLVFCFCLGWGWIWTRIRGTLWFGPIIFYGTKEQLDLLSFLWLEASHWAWRLTADIVKQKYNIFSSLNRIYFHIQDFYFYFPSLTEPHLSLIPDLREINRNNE